MQFFTFMKFFTACTLLSAGSIAERTCSPLNSVSRAATCSRFGDRVRCESPVLPYTRAKVTCRINYGLEDSFVTGIERDVECRPNGRWEPEPITCSPVCGVANGPGEEKQAINGIAAEAGAFPWHADLWREIRRPRGLELEFRCGATIIHRNLVVTAARCVTDERTGATLDTKRLRVTAGKKVTGASDAAENFPWRMHKAKNVHRYCQRFGHVHGYAADIAIVELQDRFQFSSAVLPACLDISSYSQQNFRPGTRGRTAGVTNAPNTILRSMGVTYIPNSECEIPSGSNQGNGPVMVIRDDEFCGVHSNGATVCEWHPGSGFVVKKNGLWHLMGISIKNLGSGLQSSRKSCEGDSHSLYTKVPSYMAWIQDVMFQLERYKSYPPCRFDL